MQIDWWTLGLQTINFLVVVWLLSRFLYRPIRKIIEDREAADQAATAAADQMVEEAEKTRREYEEKRAQLMQEQQDREAAFQKELDAEKAKRLDAARKQAAGLLAEAHARIERDRRQALENLKDQVRELAADLARTALSAPSSVDEAIAQVTAHLDAMPPLDFDHLKSDLKSEGTTLAIVTSGSLSDADKRAWHDAMSSRLGKSADLVFLHDPDILGGVELHFPHADLRFSVADRLDRAMQSLEA